MFDAHSDQVSYMMYLFLTVGATARYTVQFCLSTEKRKFDNTIRNWRTALFIDIQRTSVYIKAYTGN